MNINIIVACDKNGAIGKNGKIPWHEPSDLQFFKQTTSNCPVIMGRKTFESLPFREGLPNRLNIILTKNIDYKVKGCRVCHSLEEVLLYLSEIEYCKEYNKDGYTILTDRIYDNCFVIGGSSIYKLFLKNNLVNNIYKSNIPIEVQDADTYFPKTEAEKWFNIDNLTLNNGITVDILKNKCMRI